LLISASHGRDAEILAVAQRVQLVIGG
jgi:hypothetical protein